MEEKVKTEEGGRRRVCMKHIKKQKKQGKNIQDIIQKLCIISKTRNAGHITEEHGEIHYKHFNHIKRNNTS